MKRTVAAFSAFAALGALAGCQTTTTEEIVTRGQMPMTSPAQAREIAAMRAKVAMAPTSGIQQANYNSNGGYPPEVTGPMESRMGMMMGHGGILPSPGMGAPGVVAGVGFAGPSTFGVYSNQRTSVRFASPAGMKIAFQDPARGFVDAGREAPVRYNFPQGQIYRVRLTNVPNRPGKSYYPTIELYPATAKTVTFLSHSTVPIGFTDEDFDQVTNGNLVVKVVYLPDAQFQDLAAAEEIVSTRLEAGVGPIAEANRRGSILAIIRIGNIDLEDPSTPAMDAPAGWGTPSKQLSAPMKMSKAPETMPPLNIPGLPK